MFEKVDIPSQTEKEAAPAVPDAPRPASSPRSAHIPRPEDYDSIPQPPNMFDTASEPVPIIGHHWKALVNHQFHGKRVPRMKPGEIVVFLVLLAVVVLAFWLLTGNITIGA